MDKSTLQILESISHEIDVVLQEITPETDAATLDDLFQRLKSQSRRLASIVITWDVVLAAQNDRELLDAVARRINLINDRELDGPNE